MYLLGDITFGGIPIILKMLKKSRISLKEIRENFYILLSCN